MYGHSPLYYQTGVFQTLKFKRMEREHVENTNPQLSVSKNPDSGRGSNVHLIQMIHTQVILREHCPNMLAL